MIEPVFGLRVEGCPYVVRPSAYALIRDAGGFIAVVRAPAATLFPGGGIEPGETPEETIRREAAEECGLAIEPGDVIASATQIVYLADENICYEKSSTFLRATIVGTVAPTELDHELLWLDRHMAREVLSYESHRWVLDSHSF